MYIDRRKESCYNELYIFSIFGPEGAREEQKLQKKIWNVVPCLIFKHTLKSLSNLHDY